MILERNPRIGVLALQGNFAAHARALEAAGTSAAPVRGVAELNGLSGIILPGGESTALLRLMDPLGMVEALLDFHRRGGVLFGTCAGLILLAARVRNPDQPSLRLLDCTVKRNAWGRQIDSFIAPGRLSLPGRPDEDSEMVFIRAPRVLEVGPQARVYGRLGPEPVLLGQGRILAATFHPEMSAPPAGGHPVHRFFLDLVERAAGRRHR